MNRAPEDEVRVVSPMEPIEALYGAHIESARFGWTRAYLITAPRCPRTGGRIIELDLHNHLVNTSNEDVLVMTTLTKFGTSADGLSVMVSTPIGDCFISLIPSAYAPNFPTVQLVEALPAETVPAIPIGKRDGLRRSATLRY